MKLRLSTFINLLQICYINVNALNKLTYRTTFFYKNIRVNYNFGIII